jgi:hypothetical protein
MRVRLTHLLEAGTPGTRPVEALAREREAPERRLFVPGWLPCGECGRCRRGLVAACPRGHTLADAAPGLAPGMEIELDGRFLVALDEPGGATPLDDQRAASAGLVAEVLETTARAGLGPEHLAVWIGDDARCALGAGLSAARGCPTFRLASAPPTTNASSPPAVTELAPTGDAAAWREALQATPSAAPGGVRERRLFLASADPPSLAAALALLEPGSALSLLDASGGALLPLSQVVLGRVLVAVGGRYHPDFLPEALAVLRRESLAPDLLPVRIRQ